MLVHGWLTFVGVVVLPDASFHDVDLYRYWMWLGFHHGVWPVLTTDWVYPAGALLPLILPSVAGTADGRGYVIAWCILVALLDAVAVWILLRRGRATIGAWWWMAFLALLGPVAIGRLDAVVVPLMIGALAVAATRPRVASALLTAGAWIKVAPGAILLALVLAVRRPWRDVVLPAALVSAVVVVAVAIGGGTSRVASFMSEQGTRGLQIESVGATPWIIARFFTSSVHRNLNEELSTWEIVGPGSTRAANMLGLVFFVALAALAVLLWWVRRRAGDGLHTEVFVVRGALVVTTALIVFNKVGSPQYLAWLAAPVAIALAMRLPGWRRSAWIVLVMAALTQIVFPLFYTSLLNGNLAISLVLVVRNVLLIALLAQSIRDLIREEPGGTPERAGTAPGSIATLPTT